MTRQPLLRGCSCAFKAARAPLQWRVSYVALLESGGFMQPVLELVAYMGSRAFGSSTSPASVAVSYVALLESGGFMQPVLPAAGFAHPLEHLAQSSAFKVFHQRSHRRGEDFIERRVHPYRHGSTNMWSMKERTGLNRLIHIGKRNSFRRAQQPRTAGWAFLALNKLRLLKGCKHATNHHGIRIQFFGYVRRSLQCIRLRGQQNQYMHASSESTIYCHAGTLT